MDYNLRLGERLDVSIEGRACVSSIQEITAQGTLRISAPMYRSVVVNLRPGDRVDIVYYRPQGLCSFTAGVLRAINDRVQMFEVEIVSPIRKFQRREYVRLDISLTVHLALLAAPDALQSMPVEDVLQLAYDKTDKTVTLQPQMPSQGLTIDISGGGLRAQSPLMYPAGSLIECKLHLRNGEVFHSHAKVVRCVSCSEPGRMPYTICVQFVNVNEEGRRRVIRYIFDEQVKERRIKSR
ncbi:MAG: flagellar brake protein [Oscillospiraceae bacterium]|nr:flagellar brake protein [Oscillospiraceae bacterium]